MQKGRGEDYQTLLNRTPDEIKAHVNNLLRCYENGKDKERLEALRQFCFLGSIFLAYKVIDESIPFTIDDKFIQYLFLDLRYSLKDNLDVSKRTPFNTPRSLALLTSCLCRFFSENVHIHSQFYSMDIQ